jgi:hypothetical protein
MKLTQEVSLRVIALFSVAILSTFIGEFGHDFFGDWKCNGSGNTKEVGYGLVYTGCNYASLAYHSPQWHWGYRHWLYGTMCFTLFIIQVVEIVNHVNTKTK